MARETDFRNELSFWTFRESGVGGGSLSLTKAGSRKSEARSLVSHLVRSRMSTSGLDEEVGKVGDEVRWVRWGSGGEVEVRI